MREATCYRNGAGMELVEVPTGEFMMGSALSANEVHERWPGGKPEYYRGEHPQHRVRITTPFFMGKYAVKRGEFAAFVEAAAYETDADKLGEARTWRDGKWAFYTGVNWRDPFFAQTDDHPVVCVTWNDAKAFCDWLSDREGVAYRLPTEAEWEYAARAGTTTIWYWGDNELGANGHANMAGEDEEVDWPNKFEGLRDGFTFTAPVGSFKANGLGLCDMVGNVQEFCADFYDEAYYSQSPLEDPQGPQTGAEVTQRGASWIHFPRSARIASRGRHAPDYPSSNYGFRVVCTASLA